MILAHIDHPGTYLPVLGSQTWQQALDWIKTHAHNSPQGIFELKGRDMYVNVHGYNTLPENQCRFESHKHYIDLQYCITGGERIAWQLVTHLTAAGEYDEKKDFQFYKPASSAALLTLSPGCFAVFFPEDGHRPKQEDGINEDVWKLVVKIYTRLLKDDHLPVSG
jgi:YhcH/YjgK/YiaL family protein